MVCKRLQVPVCAHSCASNSTQAILSISIQCWKITTINLITHNYSTRNKAYVQLRS